jgi:hypothetical protein
MLRTSRRKLNGSYGGRRSGARTVPTRRTALPLRSSSNGDTRLPLTGANDARPYGSHEAGSPTRAACCSAGAIRQSGGRGQAAAARSKGRCPASDSDVVRLLVVRDSGRLHLPRFARRALVHGHRGVVTGLDPDASSWARSDRVLPAAELRMPAGGSRSKRSPAPRQLERQCDRGNVMNAGLSVGRSGERVPAALAARSGS